LKYMYHVAPNHYPTAIPTTQIHSTQTQPILDSPFVKLYCTFYLKLTLIILYILFETDVNYTVHFI
jgi:hypothetical protein